MEKMKKVEGLTHLAHSEGLVAVVKCFGVSLCLVLGEGVLVVGVVGW